MAVCAIAVLVVFIPASPVRADVIISGTFISTGSRQPLDGTQAGLVVDAPGGNWMWGAGWDWGAPFISATWDPPGVPANIATLSEEKTALGISIASSGTYVKPSQFSISADISPQVTGNPGGGGLGFWSASTSLVQNDSANSITGFTGLLLQGNGGVSDGTLSLVENGTIVGSAVDLGEALTDNTFYSLTYDVNTVDGSISDINFDGTPITGITSSAFTDTATTYAGLMSASSGRLSASDFNVSGIAVPEPRTYAMLFCGFAMSIGLRRMNRRRA